MPDRIGKCEVCGLIVYKMTDGTYQGHRNDCRNHGRKDLKPLRRLK